MQPASAAPGALQGQKFPCESSAAGILKRSLSRRALLAGLALPAPARTGQAHTGQARATDAAFWAALRGSGHVALMRHATAPGVGDPPGFRLEACETQRNLSEGGRAEAGRAGAAFREAGLGALPVRSSQWCRCLETARLLGLGPVEPWPVLNSFFQNSAAEAAATDALRRWIGARHGEGAALLVTHQVNITALTGIFPASGEVVAVRADGGVAGRWRLPA